MLRQAWSTYQRTKKPCPGLPPERFLPRLSSPELNCRIFLNQICGLLFYRYWQMYSRLPWCWYSPHKCTTMHPEETYLFIHSWHHQSSHHSKLPQTLRFFKMFRIHPQWDVFPGSGKPPPSESSRPSNFEQTGLIVAETSQASQQLYA